MDTPANIYDTVDGLEGVESIVSNEVFKDSLY